MTPPFPAVLKWQLTLRPAARRQGTVHGANGEALTRPMQQETQLFHLEPSWWRHDLHGKIHLGELVSGEDVPKQSSEAKRLEDGHRWV